MRIKNYSRRTRLTMMRSWHPWFAWHPVHAGDNLVWLERVRRQWIGTNAFGYWTYS